MTVKCILLVRSNHEVFQRSFHVTDPPTTVDEIKSLLQSQDLRLQSLPFHYLASSVTFSEGKPTRLTCDDNVRQLFSKACGDVFFDVTITGDAAAAFSAQFVDKELVPLLIFPPLTEGDSSKADVTEKLFIIPLTGVLNALKRAVYDTINDNDPAFNAAELTILFVGDGIPNATPVQSDRVARKTLEEHIQSGSACKLTYRVPARPCQETKPTPSTSMKGATASGEACLASWEPMLRTAVPRFPTVPQDKGVDIGIQPTSSPKQSIPVGPMPSMTSGEPRPFEVTAEPISMTKSGRLDPQAEATAPSVKPGPPVFQTSDVPVHVCYSGNTSGALMTFRYAKRESGLLQRFCRECTDVLHLHLADAEALVISGGVTYELPHDGILREWLALAKESFQSLRVVVRGVIRLPSTTASPFVGCTAECVDGGAEVNHEASTRAENDVATGTPATKEENVLEARDAISLGTAHAGAGKCTDVQGRTPMSEAAPAHSSVVSSERCSQRIISSRRTPSAALAVMRTSPVHLICQDTPQTFPIFSADDVPHDTLASNAASPGAANVHDSVPVIPRFTGTNDAQRTDITISLTHSPIKLKSSDTVLKFKSPSPPPQREHLPGDTATRSSALSPVIVASEESQCYVGGDGNGSQTSEKVDCVSSGRAEFTAYEVQSPKRSRSSWFSGSTSTPPGVSVRTVSPPAAATSSDDTCAVGVTANLDLPLTGDKALEPANACVDSVPEDSSGASPSHAPMTTPSSRGSVCHSHLPVMHPAPPTTESAAVSTAASGTDGQASIPFQSFVLWGTKETLLLCQVRPASLLGDLKREVSKEFQVVFRGDISLRVFLREVGTEGIRDTEITSNAMLLDRMKSLSVFNTMLVIRSASRSPANQMVKLEYNDVLYKLAMELACYLGRTFRVSELCTLLLSCERDTADLEECQIFFEHLHAMPEASLNATVDDIVGILHMCFTGVNRGAAETVATACLVRVAFLNTSRPTQCLRYYFFALYRSMKNECGVVPLSSVEALLRHTSITPVGDIASRDISAGGVGEEDFYTLLRGRLEVEESQLSNGITLARMVGTVRLRNYRQLSLHEVDGLALLFKNELRHSFDDCPLAQLEAFVHGSDTTTDPVLQLLLSIVGSLLAPSPMTNYAHWFIQHFKGKVSHVLFAKMRSFTPPAALPLSTLYCISWELLKPDLNSTYLQQKSIAAGRFAQWAFFAVQLECLGRNVQFPPIPAYNGISSSLSPVCAADLPIVASMESPHMLRVDEAQLKMDARQEKKKVQYRYMYQCNDHRSPSAPYTAKKTGNLPMHVDSQH